MKDLTIIFLTTNEVPEEWAKYHKEVLIDSADGAQIISISMKPIDLGKNILQTEPKSPSNIYWQLLRGAKLAETKFVAVAEDDTLYNREHFNLRPNGDEFVYNMTHWSLFTWGEPIYNWRNRRGNYSMIAPRNLLIEALEERFARWPEGIPDNRVGELGKPMSERNMRVTVRKAAERWTTIPIINFNHGSATDELQLNQRKRMGMIRCYDVPHFGKAKDLVLKFR